MTNLLLELASFILVCAPFAIANGVVIVQSLSLPLYAAKIALIALPFSYLVFQLWKRSYAVKLATGILAIIAGGEVYAAYQFRGVSGSSLYSIIISSNWSESWSFLITRADWVIYWIVFCWVTSAIAIRLTSQHHFKLSGFAMLCLWCIAGYGWYIGAMSADLYGKERNANRYPTENISPNMKMFGEERLPPILSSIKDTFPFGLPIRFWMFSREETYLRRMEQQLQLFRFGAESTGVRPAQETYILVIGESARYDRWAMNGYTKDTSPNLSSAKDAGELVSMADMMTPRAFTMGSVAIYLTGRDTMRDGATRKSLISAFKEAGFKTYYLSTQVQKGYMSNVASLYASEADVQQYFESDESLGGAYDEVLVVAAKKILSASVPKKLIVLHTMGSHVTYTARYPQEFERFKPVSDGKIGGIGDRFENMAGISNAYDNSIYYTDHVLGGLMEAMSAVTGYAAMIYGSDHGQTLPSEGCKFMGHGVMNDETLHVPYVVWANKKFRVENAAQWNTLIKNQTKPVRTTSNFPTLLDMAGIRYNGFDGEESLFRSTKRNDVRMISNMDNSEFDLFKSKKTGEACNLLSSAK